MAYLRTSSAANVGADKDRQRAAIEAFAKRASFTTVDEYYDAAVSGDPVDQRPGFAEMLLQLAANGAKTIIVESPDRFARDLAVQLVLANVTAALRCSGYPHGGRDALISWSK